MSEENSQVALVVEAAKETKGKIGEEMKESMHVKMQYKCLVKRDTIYTSKLKLSIFAVESSSPFPPSANIVIGGPPAINGRQQCMIVDPTPTTTQLMLHFSHLLWHIPMATSKKCFSDRIKIAIYKND